MQQLRNSRYIRFIASATTPFLGLPRQQCSQRGLISGFYFLSATLVLYQSYCCGHPTPSLYAPFRIPSIHRFLLRSYHQTMAYMLFTHLAPPWPFIHNPPVSSQSISMQQGVAFAPHLPGLLHVVDHATCSRPWIAAQGPGKHTLTDCNLGIKMRPIKPIRIVHSGGVLGVGSTIGR